MRIVYLPMQHINFEANEVVILILNTFDFNQKNAQIATIAFRI
ncbi:MAG: hypothetical protein U0V04_11665 [Spirosomataceae bacterium]